MLVPPAAPAYAFGNHVVHLTAKATPGKKSGAKAVSAVVGVITEFTIPTAASALHGVAPGPDGNLWFVEQSGNKIGRITPAGSIIRVSNTDAAQPSVQHCRRAGRQSVVYASRYRPDW
jgi:streptogramin lyase